ncbi:hypothetical protein IEQ34_000446 [Dendrobium chrysotoxum]|uniref:Cytochrome P450 n=1 Tax=Dendrobium chrysotoxum TaxID=161865 RepID=A0AAV7HSY6_DENCH|nr:hypothetical protein IEQ34_000446 [Dendrobium chrysotoxum]
MLNNKNHVIMWLPKSLLSRGLSLVYESLFFWLQRSMAMPVGELFLSLLVKMDQLLKTRYPEGHGEKFSPEQINIFPMGYKL